MSPGSLDAAAPLYSSIQSGVFGACACAAFSSSAGRRISRLFPRFGRLLVVPSEAVRSAGGDLFRRSSKLSLASRNLFFCFSSQPETPLCSSLPSRGSFPAHSCEAWLSAPVSVGSEESPVKLGRALWPPLPIELVLISAVLFDPIICPGCWCPPSSFLRDSRHRFLFSLSGSACSAEVGISSTWSISEPSLNELWSDVGGDDLGFSIFSGLACGAFPLAGTWDARGVGSDGVSEAALGCDR